jgi:hypothetical protein
MSHNNILHDKPFLRKSIKFNLSSSRLCCNSRCYSEATTDNQFDEQALLLCLLQYGALSITYLQLAALYWLAFKHLVKMILFILLQQSNDLNFMSYKKIPELTPFDLLDKQI